MKVTQCDRCKTTGNEMMFNRWIEIRYSEGELARFTGARNRTIELCESCYREVMERITPTKGTQ